MNNKVLALIKTRYCEDHGIKAASTVSMTFCQVNSFTGNPVFFVEVTGTRTETYTYPRIDLAGLSSHRSLDIPIAYRNSLNANPNKEFIADWVYRFTGHRLLSEDIQFLTLEKDHLTVVISPDSMRFKNSFQIKRL